MSNTDTPNEPVITSYAKAPARTVTAGGVTYAYRELGPKGGIPVVFFVHLAATLDNWDPRIIDPIAKGRHVITFDNRGVGASTGQVPDSIEAMADDAYTFITALGFDKIDLFSFSLGGIVAQALVVKHPELVRKLVLTGTGPKGGKDIEKVVGTTYYDILRATLTRSDPKEFLFFNRNATGKPAARAFVKRLEERTADRDAPIKVKAFQTQLKAIQKWGRSAPDDLSKLTQPTLIANGDNDRMVPSILSEDLHRRIKDSRADHLPRLRPRRHLPVPREVRPDRRRVPRPLTTNTSSPDHNEKGNIMSTSLSAVQPEVKKHLSSSILLWVRNDQPRQTGMDHWKGPHSGIISATPGLEEYRQIHLAEHNPGRWPVDRRGGDLDPRRPEGRRRRGSHLPIGALAPERAQADAAGLQGRDQRVPPHAAVHRPAELVPLVRRRRSGRDVVGARALVYLRRREGVGAGEFRKFVKQQLVPVLAGTGVLKELRTQTFLPWIEKLWDTPNVAHDNPHDQQFHASVVLGFTDAAARDAFFASNVLEELSSRLAPLASAIHAYDVDAALTYVKNGVILPAYEE